MTKKERTDVYDLVTERILALLDEGTVPWRKPWNARTEMPRNLVSRKPYRGINVFLLTAQHYASPYWLTFKQAKERGGCVRKGEKGSPVIFWKWLHYPDHDAKPNDDGSTPDKRVPLLRYYHVFNVAQVDGLANVPAVETTGPAIGEREPIAEADAIIRMMPDPPRIIEANEAYYSTLLDTVGVPPAGSFPVLEEWYSSAFHELAHSTGHASRLSRKAIVNGGRFGSYQYGQEELVAEFTASMLCAMSGITPATIANTAAYIESWRRVIRADNKVVVMAAAAAQHASDYILRASVAEAADTQDDHAQAA